MSKKIVSLATLALFLGALAVSFFAYTESAEAIPAFARKYSMSCTTCHAPVPKLKAYGDEFAGNGFVLKDKEAPRYFMEAGDENLSLIRDFPIAVRLDGYIKYHSNTDKNVDLTSPYLVKFLSGGSLAKNLAYYFYFYMNERGEVAGVEDAYIMFNNLFGSELDVYLGQFQISDPLFKRELRLTYEDYEIYRHKPGDSKINLAYDRGVMLTYGFPSGTDIIVEVVNGNGLVEADDFRVYDEDKYKGYIGRISQDIGDFFRIGGIGYTGKEGLTGQNEVWMAGPDMTLNWTDRLELNLQYLIRNDSDPLFAGTDSDIETKGGFGELVIMPDGDRSRWYGVLLGNYVESDLGDYKYQTVSAHLGHLLRTNIRLVGEFIYDIENEESTFVMGFVSGF